MKAKRIVGSIVFILGVGAIAFSLYIKSEVAEGRKQIASGQRTVDSGKQLFGFVPEAEPVGDALTSSAQKKINQGRKDVAYYERMSHWLMGIGIVLGAIGAFVAFGPQKKEK